MPDYIPSGIDRAIGINGFPGTPTPNGAVVKQPSQFFFEELPNSPSIERGEQATIVHQFRTDPDNARNIIFGLSRGALFTDSQGDITRCLTVTYQYEKGDVVLITITSEGVSFDAPPDEFEVDEVEFNPSLFLHPRYSMVVNYSDNSASGTPFLVTGPQIIGWVNSAVDLPAVSSQQEQFGQLNSTNITNTTVLALAKELVTKLKRGEDTFYLAGFRVTWSQYFFLPPLMCTGGFIESPVQGGLPFYFWSANGGPDGLNILEALAAVQNPNLYGQGLSWLRQCDHLTYQRTWFKQTHTWIGGPAGQWDTQLYSQQNVLTPSP